MKRNVDMLRAAAEMILRRMRAASLYTAGFARFGITAQRFDIGRARHTARLQHDESVTFFTDRAMNTVLPIAAGRVYKHPE